MKSKKGAYQIQGYPEISHLVSFSSPLSSLYQSLGTGLLETLIRFETVSSMPGLTKIAKNFIESKCQAASKFVEKFPQRKNDIQNFYNLYQILVSPDYQTQQKHASLSHYLENELEYASAVDYGTRILISLIFAGKDPKQIEIMQGQDRDTNGIMQGFAETFKLKILLIDQNFQSQEFCSSTAGNYPLLCILSANANFYLCYTKAMIEIETNPQLIEEKVRDPGLVYVKQNAYMRTNTNPPIALNPFNGNPPGRSNPVPDQNLNQNEGKALQFLPIQVIILIEKMALVINKNNIFDSVTIESAKAASNIFPQLAQMDSLKSLIQMPQPRNEPAKIPSFTGGNMNFNGFEMFPRYPDGGGVGNNRNIEEFDRANAFRQAPQPKFATEQQIACNRCNELRDKSIYSNLACPDNCILCPICRSTNKLQCIKCQRHYSDDEKDFLPILVESLTAKR